jgi:hypothetical protein
LRCVRVGHALSRYGICFVDIKGGLLPSCKHIIYYVMYTGGVSLFCLLQLGVCLNSQALDPAVNVVRYCTFHMEPRLCDLFLDWTFVIPAPNSVY